MLPTTNIVPLGGIQRSQGATTMMGGVMLRKQFLVLMLVFAVAVFSGCTRNSPGPIEGTWELTELAGIMRVTMTFRPGEAESLGIIDKVTYRSEGRDVIVTYETGLSKGSAMRVTVVDENTIRTDLGTFRRVRNAP